MFLVPTTSINDWKELLASPEKHWREGYSAHALATRWQDAKGFPPDRRKGEGVVRANLGRVDARRDAREDNAVECIVRLVGSFPGLRSVASVPAGAPHSQRRS